MGTSYYASGKILLSSEYLVLHGAKALAHPLKKGQRLILEEKKEAGILHWIATYNEKSWFEAKFSLPKLETLSGTDKNKSEYLAVILKKLVEMRPGFMDQLKAFDVHTELEFDPGFGFGSSSTLTSLLAQWAGVDPMQFHFAISSGSGYDVACADSGSPILYQVLNEMPVVEHVDFMPPFVDKLWLVYLGEKQETADSVKKFLDEYEPRDRHIQQASHLTFRMMKAGTLEEFGEIILAHESLISGLIGLPPIGETRFADLNGYVKSLGAWGGDFALMATDMNAQELEAYLDAKNITTMFPFTELVI